MLLLNLDRTSKVPLFEQIASQIQGMIDKGILRPGERLPPTRNLAQALGVHRSTVYKAYEELWTYGYVESRPGSYSRVRKKHELATPGQKSSCTLNWQRLASPASCAVFDTYHQLPQRFRKEDQPDLINMATLDLDTRLFPVDDFRKGMNRVLLQRGQEIMSYGDSEGYRPLREAVAQRLQVHGIATHWDEILITNGAQNGFDLIMKLLTRPGDRVLVESPTYSLALPTLQYYQTRITGIPMEATGLSLPRLEEELKKGDVAFLYTIPNFQNPTGITTPQAHREKLLALCEAHQVPVVEDAFEEEMKYFGKVPLPIKSMDKRQIVIYLGTFSKVLFPGIRIGFVAADRECVQRLTALKRFGDLSTNNIIQAALAEFCAQGLYDAHIQRMHRIFRKRMQRALDLLREHVNHPNVSWEEPTGGYLIWICLHDVMLSDTELQHLFNESGVRVATGDIFFPRKPARSYFRLSISTLDQKEIEEGIRRIGKAVQHIYRLDRKKP